MGSVMCATSSFLVMAGLVPAISDFSFSKFMDARHEAGHDQWKNNAWADTERDAP